MEHRREQLRTTFDGAAERYDAARPGYPAGVLDDLVLLAGLRLGSRVLEIGCGTGQLTVPLAERGMRITAVELGAGLAAVARRNLAAFPHVDVLVGAFEELPLDRGSVDLVVAATSFHWLDPAVRVPRAADLLRPGGALAVIDTEHVAGGTTEFFHDSQRCYERWDPENTPLGLRLQPVEEIPTTRPELDDSPLFEPVRLRRRTTDITYTAAEYLALLLTYSGHLAMPPTDRDGLLGCLRSLIDDRYGGTVTKRYLTELRVALRSA